MLALRIVSRLFGALGLMGVWAGPALATERPFVLENGSGSHICYVYLAPEQTNDWEEGYLSEDCLAPGESVRISFDDGAKGRLWKVRVEDADNEYEEYRGFDFSRLSKITVLGEGRALVEP